VGFKTFVVFVVIITSISCTRFRENQAYKTALAVNGEKLTAGDFSKQLAKKMKAFDALAAKDPTNIKRTKDLIINEFIVNALLRQKSQHEGASISDDELDLEFEKIRKSYPDDITFKAALAENSASIKEWRENLRKSLLEKKAFALLSPVATDSEALKDAHAYYDSHKAEFQRPQQVHIKQIAVAKRDDAERILKALKSGTSFDSLAKKYSISPDAARGGEIDYISKGAVPIFDSAFNLRPGQLSSVIDSSYGFHILKLIDKKSAMLLTFEQAKPIITRRILGQKQQSAFSAWLETNVKSAKIERNDDLLNKLTVHTEGILE
jgi:peptidyl-prolyl cis-trans isomerase C